MLALLCGRWPKQYDVLLRPLLGFRRAAGFAVFLAALGHGVERVQGKFGNACRKHEILRLEGYKT